MTFATGVAPSRAAALALVRKYRDGSAASRVFSMAFTHAHITLQHLGLNDEQAMLFDRLASRVFGADASCISPTDISRATPWASRTSGATASPGDLPIVLVRVTDAGALPLVRQLLHAQEYWRVKGLRADVVILNEHPVDYLDEMQDLLTSLVQEPRWAGWNDKPGGMFLLRADGMAEADRRLLAAVARVVLRGDLGDLAPQLDRPAPWLYAGARRALRSTELRRPEPAATPVAGAAARDGERHSAASRRDGREYVVVLDGDRETPLPWSNVLANPEFGTMVTAARVGVHLGRRTAARTG